MANTKKKVTVPKTVSIRKYSELKAKYDKLTENAAKVGAENIQLKTAIQELQADNNKLIETFTKAKNSASADPGCSINGSYNPELKALEEMVNIIQKLNPFQRRFAIGALLSNNLERNRMEIINLANAKRNSLAEAEYRVGQFNQLKEDMAQTASAIEKYTVSS